MKSLLDFAPAIAFIVAYYWGDIYIATATLIASLFLVVAAYRVIERRWHKLHLTAAIAAGVLGGITLAIHDPTFIKLKPSVVYALFGLVLLGSHFVGDRVLLQRLPQKMVQMPDLLWRRVNLVWAAFFMFCAVLNYIVAFHADEATWVQLKAFGFTLLNVAFLLAHLPFLSRYVVSESKGAVRDPRP